MNLAFTGGHFDKRVSEAAAAKERIVYIPPALSIEPEPSALHQLLQMFGRHRYIEPLGFAQNNAPLAAVDAYNINLGPRVPPIADFTHEP